jgi:hypothetical protein
VALLPVVAYPTYIFNRRKLRTRRSTSVYFWCTAIFGAVVLTIASWRVDYNEVRPHSSSGRVPPAKFASLHRQQAADAARPQKADE